MNPVSHRRRQVGPSSSRLEVTKGSKVACHATDSGESSQKAEERENREGKKEKANEATVMLNRISRAGGKLPHWKGVIGYLSLPFPIYLGAKSMQIEQIHP